MGARTEQAAAPEVVGPVIADGAALRGVPTADGGLALERWDPSAAAWVPGGGDWSEILSAPPASPAALAALGVPADPNSAD